MKKNFKEIYFLLQEYGFYFLDDVILNYLELFEMSVEEVTIGIEKLKEQLREQFVLKIGNNMSYLDEIIHL